LNSGTRPGGEEFMAGFDKNQDSGNDGQAGGEAEAQLQ
jgi:hypothetical protein